ncbi:MAG: group II intron maturase-specific domain-containing protein [Bacillota bacterium]
MRGWTSYFRLADMKWLVADTEGWIRRRLRMCLWKQWKRMRTRLRELRALGLAERDCWQMAMSSRGYWHMAY